MRVSHACSSTSAAWLTSDGTDYVSIPAILIEAAYAREPGYTTETHIGATPTTLVIPTLRIIPLASSRTAGVVPHLYGLHAAEVVGDS